MKLGGLKKLTKIVDYSTLYFFSTSSGSYSELTVLFYKIYLLNFFR